jgi:hypothetical protein
MNDWRPVAAPDTPEPGREYGVRAGLYVDPHETLAEALRTIRRDGGELVARDVAEAAA